MRSSWSASRWGMHEASSLGGLGEKLDLWTADSAGHSSSDGRPMTLKILLSWSISYWPSKKGAPRKSSAKMQPQDHMSTGVAYGKPSRTSGLLYHRVTT